MYFDKSSTVELQLSQLNGNIPKIAQNSMSMPVINSLRILWFSVYYAATLRRAIFGVKALRKTTPARFTKFAGYFHFR